MDNMKSDIMAKAFPIDTVANPTPKNIVKTCSFCSDIKTVFFPVKTKLGSVFDTKQLPCPSCDSQPDAYEILTLLDKSNLKKETLWPIQ